MLEFFEDGIPGVGPDSQLGVIEAAVGCSTVASDFKTFADEEVLLKRRFCFVAEGRDDFGFIPGYIPGGAVAGMFANAGYIFVGFVGSDVRRVLPHAGAEGYARLADVFRVWVAATGQLVDALLVKVIRTSLVGCA